MQPGFQKPGWDKSVVETRLIFRTAPGVRLFAEDPEKNSALRKRKAGQWENPYTSPSGFRSVTTFASCRADAFVRLNASRALQTVSRVFIKQPNPLRSRESAFARQPDSRRCVKKTISPGFQTQLPARAIETQIAPANHATFPSLASRGGVPFRLRHPGETV